MAEFPDWVIDELLPFATGECSWGEWPRWLAMHASRLAVEIPRDWFLRIKMNPEVEVVQLVAFTGVAIIPHSRIKIVVDPLENNDHFSAVIALADQLAAAEIGESQTEMGQCHVLWAAKKQILKSRFGLDWNSPAELNPDIIFD